MMHTGQRRKQQLGKEKLDLKDKLPAWITVGNYSLLKSFFNTVLSIWLEITCIYLKPFLVTCSMTCSYSLLVWLVVTCSHSQSLIAWILAAWKHLKSLLVADINLQLLAVRQGLINIFINDRVLPVKIWSITFCFKSFHDPLGNLIKSIIGISTFYHEPMPKMKGNLWKLLFNCNATCLTNQSVNPHK